MWYKIFQIPILRFIFETAKAIPIASARENSELLEKSFETIDEELANGNIVCIFPEGAITADGNVQTFRPGIERMIERRPVPVIPLAVSGLWGSWFSRRRGCGLRTIPGRLFRSVRLRVGEPVNPVDASAARLELLVRTLRGDQR
jgi:1-acyl-sn-glycerol-3-phosphate acyltransferase